MSTFVVLANSEVKNYWKFVASLVAKSIFSLMKSRKKSKSIFAHLTSFYQSKLHLCFEIKTDVVKILILKFYVDY